MQQNIELKLRISEAYGELGLKDFKARNIQRLGLRDLQECDNNGFFEYGALSGKVYSIKYVTHNSCVTIPYSAYIEWNKPEILYISLSDINRYTCRQNR